VTSAALPDDARARYDRELRRIARASLFVPRAAPADAAAPVPHPPRATLRTARKPSR
jgi:hypothetical protein